MAARAQKPRGNTSSTSQKHDNADIQALPKRYYETKELAKTIEGDISKDTTGSKEIKFKLLSKENEDDLTQSVSLYDSKSSATDSHAIGENSQYNVNETLNSESNISVSLSAKESNHALRLPEAEGSDHTGVPEQTSVFKRWWSFCQDALRKTERRLIQTFGGDASDCVECGDVIQLVSRASGRPIRIVEDQGGQMTVDAKGVFATGVSDPVVINSSWGVLKSPDGSVRLCHLDQLLACMGGAAAVRSHAPDRPILPETRFRLINRGEFVRLRAEDGSHLSFTAEGEPPSCVGGVSACGGVTGGLTEGMSDEFTINLVLTSMEVAHAETKESIVEHFMDDETTKSADLQGHIVESEKPVDRA